MKHKLIAIGLSMLALAGCNPPAVDTVAIDPAAEIAEIEAASEAQMAAIQSDNVEAAVGVYAADAMIVMSGAPPVSTPEAILADFQAMAEDPNTAVANYSSANVTLSESGDMAYMTASFDYTYTDPATDEAATAPVQVLTVWRKEDDGTWKIVADYNVVGTPNPVGSPEDAAGDTPVEDTAAPQS